jgi:hypothetical protein
MITVAIAGQASGKKVDAGRKPSTMTRIEEMNFHRNPVMSSSDQGAELVIYDRDSGSYHALNASASAIWRVLEFHNSPQQIVEAVAKDMAVGTDEIRADVSDFLLQAHAAGLIVALD